MSYSKNGFLATGSGGSTGVATAAASFSYVRKNTGGSVELWNQTQAYLTPGGSISYGTGTSSTVEPTFYDNVVDSWTEVGTGMPNYDFNSFTPVVTTANPLSGSGFGLSYRSIFTVPTTGTYSFSTTSDDGSDLLITQQSTAGPGTNLTVTGNMATGYVQVVSNAYGTGQGPLRVAGTVSLTAGTTYLLWSRYSQGGGGATYKAQWTAPSQTESYLTDASGTVASFFYPLHMVVDMMPYGYTCEVLNSSGTVVVSYTHRSQRDKAMIPVWKAVPLTGPVVRFKDTSGTVVSTIGLSTLTGGEQFTFNAGISYVNNYASPSINKPQGVRQRQYTFDSDTQSWTIETGGTLSQVSGVLRVTKTSAVDSTMLEPSTAANVADGELVVDYTGVTTGTKLANNTEIIGLVFRATDASNNYMMQIAMNQPSSAGSQVVFYKRVSGSYTALASSPGSTTNYMPLINRDGPHRFMVRYVGPLISLYLNETFMLSWYDATYTTGRVGVYVYNIGSYNFDNITAYALASTWTASDYTAQSTAGLPLIGTPEAVATATPTTTYTIADPLSASVTSLTLGGNITITFPTLAAGKSFTIALTQDATGSRTVTWPGTVKWPNGTAPTLSTTPGKIDLVSFVSLDGTSWLGSFTKGY